ncbi:MAG: hypothetical protein QXG90_03100 [Candidatus Nezhaarchaeales archaeon]
MAEVKVARFGEVCVRFIVQLMSLTFLTAGAVLLDRLNPLTKPGLEALKRRALRLGAWFKLDVLGRAVVDLTIRVVDKVKSPRLAQLILKIAGKLKQMIKPSFKEMAFVIGSRLADRISRLAQALGVKNASSWARDPNFIFYLGASWLNTSPIYRPPIE